MKKIKPHLTLTIIGTFRCYVGIALGIGYGLLINFLFRLLDKGLFLAFDLTTNNVTSMAQFSASSYTNFLIALTSSSLGFCYTMYFWTSKPTYENRKATFKNRITNANSIFIFMVVLFVFTKFLTFHTPLRFDGFGIDLRSSYDYYPFFLPVFIFLFNWSIISRNYKSGKFILCSAGLVIAYGILLAGIKT